MLFQNLSGFRARNVISNLLCLYVMCFFFCQQLNTGGSPTSSHVSLHHNYCLRARQPAAALAAVGRPTWWSPFLDWSSASVKRIQIAIGLLPVWPQKAWCSLWVGLAGGGSHPTQSSLWLSDLSYDSVMTLGLWFYSLVKPMAISFLWTYGNGVLWILDLGTQR